jgi:hypothetical protein
MFNIFYANWYVAIGVALVFIIAVYGITRVWGSHKFRSDGHRAIERLRKLERGEPPEPAVKPGLSPQIDIKVQVVLEREEMLEPELAVKPGLPLQVGTKVRAVRNFGPVKKGAPGIITRLTDRPLFLWSRPAYLCTFADNMKVHARPKLIEAFDHGYNLKELEQPDFASILSRRMMLRAQQLFSGHRPTCVGNALIRDV